MPMSHRVAALTALIVAGAAGCKEKKEGADNRAARKPVDACPRIVGYTYAAMGRGERCGSELLYDGRFSVTFHEGNSARVVRSDTVLGAVSYRCKGLEVACGKTVARYDPATETLLWEKHRLKRVAIAWEERPGIEQLRRKQDIAGLWKLLDGGGDAHLRYAAMAWLLNLVTAPLKQRDKPNPELTRRREQVLRRLAGPLFKDPEPLVRAGLMEVAGRSGPEALGLLERGLADPAPRVRAAAARALGGLQHTGAPAALAEAVRDKDAGVRWAALQGLSIRRQGRAVIPPVIDALKDSCTRVRYAAAALLFRVPYTRRHGLTGVDAVARAAAGQQVRDAMDQRIALPYLTRALRDPLLEVQRFAACALGNLGPGASEALPALKRLAASARDDALRSCAAQSVAKIAP